MIKATRKRNCHNFTWWTLILLMFTTTSYASTIYVDASNQGAEDGSKAKPFNSIQKGVDAAQSGDVVQVAAGTYKLDGEVRFKDGITLRGAGAKNTKIIGATEGQHIISVSNAKSGLVDGFTIDGSGKASRGFTIERSEVAITNNVITNVTDFGLFASSSTLTIANNLFIGNTNKQATILLQRSKATVKDNVIKEGRWVGIMCVSRTNATITNNEISSNWDGVQILSFSEATIRKNQIADNREVGIRVSVSAITIEENIISKNGSHGIEVNKSDMTTIHKNTIIDNGKAGINLTASKLTISENEIRDSIWGGVLLNESSGDVKGNTIENNGAEGIKIEGSQNAIVVIANNLLSSNVSDGIAMHNQSGATITGNQIIRNDRVGISIWSTNLGGIVINGNKISQNAAHGVDLPGGDSIILTGAQVKDNQITDNGVVGISMSRGRSQIRGNLITGNGASGVIISNEGTIPDLGTDSDFGKNAIYDNVDRTQLVNYTPHKIQAVGNYWGKGTEDRGPQAPTIVSAKVGGIVGSVIFAPWLKSEPLKPTIPTGPTGSFLSIITPTPNQVLPAGTTSTTLKVNIANHTGFWHYQLNKPFPTGGKVAAGGSVVESGNTATIAGLKDGQSYTVYATLLDQNRNLLDPSVIASVTFSVAAPSIIATITPTSPVIADGISTSIIAISIKDVTGKPIQNQTVAISVSGSDNLITQPSSPTDQNGQTFAKLRSTKAETKTVSITVDGTPTSTTAKVEFLADIVSTANSTIIASGSAIADGTAQIKLTITLFDASKNPVKDKKVIISSTGTGNIIVQAEKPTDERGITTASISSTKAEDKTINATVALDEVKLKSITVTFTLPPLPKLVVRATSPHIADGEDTSTIILILTDANDNPLPNAKPTVSATGTGNILIPPDSGTDESGRTVAKLKSTNPETKTITATYEFDGQKVKSTAAATVEFQPSSKSLLPPPPTQLAVSGNLIKADNVASVEVTGKASPKIQVTATLKDGINLVQKSVAADNSGLFKLNLDATSLKDGTITVVASEVGGQEASIAVIKDTKPLPIQEVQKSEYSINAINPSQGAEVGKSVTYVLKLVSKEGFKSDLTLRIADAPKGVEAEFNPKVVSLSAENPSDTSQLTLRVGKETPIGEHKFVVSAAALDKSAKEIELQLQVKAPATKSSFITIDVEPTQPRLGDEIKVKGDIIFEDVEVGARQAVPLPLTISYIQPPKGETIVQSLQTDESGRYAGEFVVKQKGKWELAATWAGDKIYKAAKKSKTIEVLKGLSQITWQPLLIEKPKVGDKISVIAQLKPALEKETIKLQTIKPDGIATLESTITQPNGMIKVDLELSLEGTWKLIASWEGNEDYEKTSSAENQLLASIEPPKAIIVLGGGSEKENPAWPKFAGLANHVYKILTRRKLTDNDIYYLSPLLKRTEVIDEVTSESALEFAITQWAKPKVGPHVPLFIYLLSHNLNDKFLLEKRGGIEVTLTPEKLNAWLDVLPKETEVMIIIEACYSGNFITKKIAGKPVLSKTGRVIITSAKEDKNAIIEGIGLLSFTKLFFNGILKNEDVKTAFFGTLNLLQTPQLDANGDGLANDETRDYPVVGNKYIPVDIQLLAAVPEIVDVSKSRQIINLNLGEKSATIKAKLTGVDISRVFGTVVPPNYDPNKEFKNWDEADFETIKFEKKEEGLYEGRYDNFTQAGIYTIVVNAENPDGSAVPVETKITVSSAPAVPSAAPDVNSDGEVNIFDLVIVAANIGREVKEGDVNSDGKVDIFDLVMVASHFGEKLTSAAPTIELTQIDYSQYLPILEGAYQLLRSSSKFNSSPEFEITRKLLERLISLAKPVMMVKETKLLPNYPNPFNPETWIPYQLSESAEVTIQIYDVTGRLIRTLRLGIQTSGLYIDKNKAAYWDGKNEIGESVASGIYYYRMVAGRFVAIRKMAIIK